MADEILKRDQNFVTVLAGITDDSDQEIKMLRVDPTTKRLLVKASGGGSSGLVVGTTTITGATNGDLLYNNNGLLGSIAPSGTGTVTSVSVVSANGFTGTVATATTTPAITLRTSITGILQGNGTAISAVTIGTGLDFTAGTLSATGTGTVTSISSADGSITVTNPTTTADLAVVKAPKLTTARNIAITGDLAWNVNFDGSAAVTAAGTLATVNSNVGTFTNATLTVNGKGLVTAASSGTAPVTSVSGTANRITVTGTTAAVVDIAATYVGQSSITTLGTITTGVWNGTAIGVNYGGMGGITTDYYVDGNRADTYTSTGTISAPYKTIGAAMTAITSAAPAAFALHIAPATYVENVTVSAFPATIMGKGATIVGNLSASKQYDIWDLNIIGNVTQSDVSLTVNHAMNNCYVQGNITTSGLAIFNGLATASGTITVSAGSTVPFLGCFLATRIVNSGTVYFDNSNLTITDNTNYAITSTANGSLFYGGVCKVVNLGTGGGINISNNAAITQPNEISSIDVVVGGTDKGITCGSGYAILSDYNIFGSSGQFYATGTNLVPTARSGGILFPGATSGVTTVIPTAVASGTITIPAATDTLVGKATTDTLTNKTYDTAGTGNSFLINGLAATANTGTGAVVRASGPTLTAPVLGTPASGVGTNLTGIPAAAILAGSFGAGAYVISTSLQVATLELGAATDTTLSRVSAGVIAVEGVTIPSISSTNTITNKRNTPRITTVNAPGATPTTNTDNEDIQNFTGVGAAITSMTTNLSGTPTDGEKKEFRFLDDGTARAITWGASFASGNVPLPSTTQVSTELRVGVEWRAASSLWECIASTAPSTSLASVDLTAQSAAITATTLYTPTTTGMYRISVYLQVTTAASTSSVLGGATGVVITYNDGDGNVAQTDTAALQTTAGAIAVTSATNTTATNLNGTLVVNAKTGVAIQYAIGYTSVGVTPMQYAAHFKIEAL